MNKSMWPGSYVLFKLETLLWDKVQWLSTFSLQNGRRVWVSQLNRSHTSLLLDSIPLLSEKVMAPHSNTLAWKISWMDEPGGLQSMGLRRVGHDWATSLLLFTFMHWRRQWPPTPVFLPGEFQGGAWWAAIYRVAQSRTRQKRLSSSSSSRGI